MTPFWYAPPFSILISINRYTAKHYIDTLSFKHKLYTSVKYTYIQTMQDIYIPAVISFLHLQHHLSHDLHYCGRTHACVNFHAFISCYVYTLMKILNMFYINSLYLLQSSYSYLLFIIAIVHRVHYTPSKVTPFWYAPPFSILISINRYTAKHYIDTLSFKHKLYTSVKYMYKRCKIFTYQQWSVFFTYNTTYHVTYTIVGVLTHA